MKNLLRIVLAILLFLIVFSCNKDNNSESANTIKDSDGNVYTSVTIGTQVWLKENLKTTKYNDGTSIPLVTDGTAWSNLTTPGYCWHDNDGTTYKAVYGALYNWYVVDAASNGGKNVCPIGWHVPTDAEWTTLTDYLGGTSGAGGKLKETGTTHWNTPNTGATNETGFTALPGGERQNPGNFSGIGLYGSWWCAPVNFDSWDRDMLYNNSNVERFSFAPKFGFSVRCVKD